MRDTPDHLIERAADELRKPAFLDRGFDARVMHAVRALPRHRFGVWARLLRPRTVTLNPLASGLAATLVLAAALSIGHLIGSARVAQPVARRAAAAPVTNDSSRDVQFVLVAPRARKVAVVGDFNDWDRAHGAFQAQHRGGGVWSVTAAVPVGHHRYSFVVDDSVWVADPAAPRIPDDDYGMPSSVLVVSEGVR